MVCQQTRCSRTNWNLGQLSQGRMRKIEFMSLIFIDREPTPREFEKFRLLLSTFQDGSGMLAIRGGKTLPGWRDFERAVAAAFEGENQENKFIFDVLISDP